MIGCSVNALVTFMSKLGMVKKNQDKELFVEGDLSL